jgi:hypothetical protein
MVRELSRSSAMTKCHGDLACMQGHAANTHVVVDAHLQKVEPAVSKPDGEEVKKRPRGRPPKERKQEALVEHSRITSGKNRVLEKVQPERASKKARPSGGKSQSISQSVREEPESSTQYKSQEVINYLMTALG